MNSRKRVQGWCAVAGVALIAVVTAGCGSDSGNSAAPSGKVNTVLGMPNLKGQTIVINTFGGSYGDALKKDAVTPFEAATGAKVVVSTNCCDAFETQVKGHQFAGDVVIGENYGTTKAWGDEGLLKSDPRLAQIAKARGVDPDLYQDNVITTGYFAVVLAWNTKYANNHPASWADFFDTSKYPGTRGLYNQPDGTLEIAQLGLGTPASSMYPIDMNKTLAGLTTLRDHTPVHFFATGADQINQLGTDQVAYSMAWSNRVAQGIQQGLPLAMTFNQAPLEGQASAIPATAKNVDGAVAFLDFSMQPDVQAAIAKDSGVAPAYPQAAEMLDPSVRKEMPTAPENLNQTVKVDTDWWLKNLGSATATYTKWLTES